MNFNKDGRKGRGGGSAGLDLHNLCETSISVHTWNVSTAVVNMDRPLGFEVVSFRFIVRSCLKREQLRKTAGIHFWPSKKMVHSIH